MGSGSSRPSHSADDNKKLYNRLHTSENEDWSGEIDDQETTSTSSPLSNGRIVRFVGESCTCIYIRCIGIAILH